MACSLIGFCYLSHEAQAAWAQAVLTVITFAFSMWFALKAQKQGQNQHRQSLRPHLSVAIHRSLLNPMAVIVEVSNDGLGPAIVFAIRVFIDGAPHDGGSETEMTRAVALLGAVGPNVTLLQVGDWIPASKSINLLTFKPKFIEVDGIPESSAAALNRDAARIRIEVDYQSVFGDRLAARSFP